MALCTFVVGKSQSKVLANGGLISKALALSNWSPVGCILPTIRSENVLLISSKSNCYHAVELTASITSA